VGTAERRFSRLRGLFPKGTCPYSLLGSGFSPRISEVRGKIETCRAHSVFLPTKPQVARVQNRGLVGRPHFFTALPSSPVDNMRQPLESPSTTAFPHKVSAGRSIAAFRSARHARDLPHTSKFWALYLLLQMLQTLD
jgi:hypothetical protein